MGGNPRFLLFQACLIQRLLSSPGVLLIPSLRSLLVFSVLAVLWWLTVRCAVLRAGLFGRLHFGLSLGVQAFVFPHGFATLAEF